MNVLNALSVGQFAAAGIGEELVRRAEGRVPRSILNSAVHGIKGKRSFSEVTGSVPIGLALDIVIDPINLLPGEALPKAAKALGAGRALEAASKATDVIAPIRRAKEALGSAMIPAYKLRKYHADEVLKLRNTHLNDIAGKTVRAGEELHNELKKLVPDESRRRMLFNLLEDEPLDLTQIVGSNKQLELFPLKPPVDDIAAFNARLAELSPKELKAFNRAKEALSEMEKMKVEANLLTQDRVAGFLKAANMTYVPRRLMRKSYTLDRMKEMADALRRGDEAIKGTADLSTVDKWIKELQDMEEVVSIQDIENMKSLQEGGFGIPSFRRLRKTKGMKVSELASDLQERVNQDIASLLGLEYANVARAVANKRYTDAMIDYLAKNKMIFHSDLLSNPDKFREILIKRFGREEALKRVREGFVEIRGVGPRNMAGLGELKDYVVPKTIADEIKGVVRKYNDPSLMRDLMAAYIRTQNIWKAHTLAIFPAYHSRNFVSNLWNSSLAGMDPVKDFKHYRAAWNVIWKHLNGTLSDSKIFGNMTEKELWRLAQDNRIVRAGEFAGEIGDTVNRYTNVENIISRVIDPAKNPAVRAGFQFGQTIEDHARLGHFMWRLAKGDDVEKAAKSVQKYLFDYKYGLTDFERKVFRDGLIPFYAWTKFNLPLQLEMLVNKPVLYTRFAKTKSAIEDQFGGPKPDEIYLADWMKRSNAMRMRWNKDKGTYEYFILDSWWPASDVSKVVPNEKTRDELLSMISPLAKFPIEIWYNYNLFQKRHISEFPGHRKKLLGLNLPARVDHLLRQIRVFNEADRIIEAFGERGAVEGFARLLAGRTYPVDIKRQREWWDYAQGLRVSELKGLLRRAKKEGNDYNINVLENQIANLEEARNERVSPRERRAMARERRKRRNSQESPSSSRRSRRRQAIKK